MLGGQIVAVVVVRPMIVRLWPVELGCLQMPRVVADAELSVIRNFLFLET